MFAADHNPSQEAGACNKAYASAIGQCPECAACPLSEIPCRTLPPYDCEDTSTEWVHEKNAWCCLEKKVGCKQAQASQPVQQDDLYECSHGPWSKDKSHWCCTNKNRCPDEASQSMDIGDHLDNLGDAMGDIPGAVTHHVGKAVDAVGDHLDNLADMSAKEMGEAAAHHAGNAVDGIGDAVGDIHGAASHHIGNAVDALGDHLDNLQDMSTKEMGQAAAHHVGNAVDGASHHIGNAVDALGDHLDDLGGVGDAMSDVHGAASHHVGKAAGDVQHHVGNFAGWVGDQIGWMGTNREDDQPEDPGEST
jgi:uncharacterized protein YjbJ (UPF0337 family)